MSLVAYGASDDSETSDVEESDTPKATGSGGTNDRAFADDGKISDEEDYVPTDRIPRGTSNLASLSVSSTKKIGLTSVSTPSALSDLPAPKAAASAEGGGDREDELEEEVKPKASQLADAPKPPPKKAKQPARIVLPALKKDSDDEEEVSSKKKTKQPVTSGSSGSRSGLFALLPPPSHSSRKQANRPLIPYTLTKRPAAPRAGPPTSSKPSPSTTTTTTTTTASAKDADLLPSQKHQSAFNALTGYESDSEEEEEGGGVASSNFFSIGNEAEGTLSVPALSIVKNSAPSLEPADAGGIRTSDVSAGVGDRAADIQATSSHTQPAPSKPALAVSDSPVVSSSSVSAPSASHDLSSTRAADRARDSKDSCVDDSDDDNDSDDDDDDDDTKVTSSVGIPQVNQDAPLTFSSSMQSGDWSTAPLTSPMFPEMYAAPVNSGAATYWQKQQHYAQEFAAGEPEASSSSGHDIQHYMEDEQFLRISGKRKRGQEDIQIIDANVDDCVDPSELMKGITEESSYQPHRKKENLPSTQQRRKKQITYLAFQAKERELELKNAWAQNRLTKNQARSKYGF